MATEFQIQVWNYLKRIPRGQVTTYGEIAKALGRPRAARAVGTAVGKNPNAPEVPCHRVVLSNGAIGDYSATGGIGKKITLLESEGVRILDGKVCDFEKVQCT